MTTERDIDTRINALAGRVEADAADRVLASLRTALREPAEDTAAISTAPAEAEPAPRAVSQPPLQPPPVAAPAPLPAPPSHPPADDPRLAALLNRLRWEDLLPAQTSDRARRASSTPAHARRRFPAWRRSWRPWAGVAVLASGLMLALLLPWRPVDPLPPLLAHHSPDFDSAPRLRSPFGPPATFIDRAGLARVLRQARAAGLPYRLGETDTGWRLHLYVPDESRAGAYEWLNDGSSPIPLSDPIRFGRWVRLEIDEPKP